MSKQHNMDLGQPVPGGSSILFSGHVFGVLDGLRGCAAIAIIVFHYNVLSAVLSNYTFKSGKLSSAYLAVDFFFLLSGFVIAHAYDARLAEGMTTKKFILRRLIRLYPLYFLGMTIPLVSKMLFSAFGMDASHTTRLVASYLISLFFLPTPLEISGPVAEPLFKDFPLNVPAWSLSLEIGVNISYVLLFRFLTTRRVAILTFIGAVSFLCCSLHYISTDIGAKWADYPGGWARIGFSFPAGILLHRLFLNRSAAEFHGCFIIIWCLLLLFIFSIPYHNPLLNLFFIFIVFPLIVWCGAATHTPQILKKLYAVLGKISYAVYIIHMPLLFCMFEIYKGFGVAPQSHYYLNGILWMSIIMLLALVADKIYDIPVRRKLTGIFLKTPRDK